MSRTIAEFRAREASVRNSALGGYFPAQFTIRLGWEVSGLIDPAGKVRFGSDIASAIFVHEYTHYLHNISTLVGAEQTVATLLMLGIFANTLSVTRDGWSTGMAALSEAQRLEYPAMRRGFQHFLQARNRNWRCLPSSIKSLQVLDWYAEPMDGHDDALQRGIVKFRVSYDRAPDNDLLLDLDTLVIEEGIAYLLESIYVEDHALQVDTPPTYPYEILRAIVQHFVPCTFPLDIVRIAIIALNTTNPGVWLLQSLSNPDVKHSLYRSRNLPDNLNWGAVFGAQKRRVVPKLQMLAKSFRDRGSLSLGIDSAVETTVRLLERRQRDPFFDVPVLTSEDRVDWAAFFSRAADIAPCEFLVAREASEHDLITFSTEPDERIIGRRALDLTVEALFAHLAGSGEFVPSSEAQRPCRYYQCCQFPARSETPQTCRTSPWSYATPDATAGRCWYGTGVLGLMAHVQLKRRASKA